MEYQIAPCYQVNSLDELSLVITTARLIDHLIAEGFHFHLAIRDETFQEYHGISN